MENNEFEDNISQALKKTRRQELKQLLKDSEEAEFEEEISYAFQNIERKRLKKLLQNAPVVQAAASKYPFWGYTKYAVAACLLLVGGLFIYRLQNQKNDVAKTEIVKNEKTDSKPQPDIIKPKNTTQPPEQFSQTFEVISDNLGYAGSSNKITVLQKLSNVQKQITYTFYKNIVTITATKRLNIKNIISYNNGYYLHMGKSYYSLTETEKSKPLSEIKDLSLLEGLEKIGYGK